MYAPSGDTYSPVTGIWQSVWLESVPAKYISEVKIFADTKQLHVNVKTSVPDADTINVTVTHGGRVVAIGAGKANLPFSIAIPATEIRLWSPESPFLYNCSLTYGTDAVRSYFGMREVSLCKDAGGINRPCINGEYRFLSGVLDQSYWPDGQYTAPGDEALLSDLQGMQKLGLNMVRLHQGQQRCGSCSVGRPDVTLKQCGHHFHASCLAAWLSEKAQRDFDDHEDCPMCRGRLSGLRRKLSGVAVHNIAV